jgi:hypothetical protein
MMGRPPAVAGIQRFPEAIESVSAAAMHYSAQRQEVRLRTPDEPDDLIATEAQ